MSLRNRARYHLWIGAWLLCGCQIAQNTAPGTVSYTLSVNVDGSGRVQSDPAGIDCGSDCSETLVGGTDVNLSALPANGFVFEGWGGACSGNASTCTFQVQSDSRATATFRSQNTTPNNPSSDPHRLSVEVMGGGSVSSSPLGILCPQDCSEPYGDNTRVTLTATPGANQQFSGWSEACSGTTTACAVTMSEARRVIARFAPIQHLLTVTLDGAGSVTSSPDGISCGTDCTQSYDHDTQVVLTAAPGIDQQFTGWAGACMGTSTTCTVAMADLRNVTARFTASIPAPYISFSANPVIVDAGDTTTLTWTVDNARTCTASGAWSGDKRVSGSERLPNRVASASYSLTCTGDGGTLTATATVAVRTTSPRHSVTLNANPMRVSSGSETTLSWSSVDMESCTASNDAANTGWSGTKPLSGTASVTLTSSTSFFLTCTGPNGSSERAVRVIIPRTSARNPPTSVTTPADLVFFDDFEYEVLRGDATRSHDTTPNAMTNCRPFTDRGWSWAKSINCTGSSNGFLYTVESSAIPGHAGAFPGTSSRRVLAMEARPSYGFQTSFHLQYGDGEAAGFDDYIPGDVWIQYWMYIAYSGGQLSQFDAGNKFLYPCNQAYPCHNQKWLTSLGVNNSLPIETNIVVPAQGTTFLATRINNTYNDPINGNPISTVVNEGVGEWDYGKLGHTNNTNFFPVTPNQWTLIKMHMNTAKTSGVYEVWMRTKTGTWVKTSEWIDSVTNGFVWQVNRNHVGGHKVLSMPTTIGSGIVERPRWDAWIYLDDFAIAHSEAGLPTY